MTIETPEGVDVALTLAGVGSRFIAALFDGLIQGTLLLASGLFLLGLDLRSGASGGFGAALFLVAFFAIYFVYDVAFEVLAGGRTPGKRWTGLRVVRTGGQPVGFLTSSVRNVLRAIDFLPFFYLVGIVSILATRRNQRLGDLAAGTVVARAPRRPAPEARVAPLQERRDPSVAAWDVSAVTAEEAAMVQSFLERRLELAEHARAELARTLADRLRPKVGGVPPDAPESPEWFLESLAAAKAARI